MSKAANKIKARQTFTLVAIIGAVLAAAFAASYILSPPAAEQKAPPPKTTVLDGAVKSTDGESWKAQTSKDMRDMRDAIEQLRKEREQAEADSKARDEARRKAEADAAAPPPPPGASGKSSGFRGGFAGDTPSPPLPPGSAPAPAPRIKTVSMDGDSSVPGDGKGILNEGTQALTESMVGKQSSAAQPPDQGSQPPKKPAVTQTYVPSGAYFRAVILSGMDAPTGGQAQSAPAPVLLRLIDWGSLPNGFRAAVRDCRVTGNGYGELSSERALIRTDRMSCVTPAGGAVDLPLQGYVSGEDGKAGLRGKVVSKTGQALVNAMWAAGASAIGAGIAGSATETNTTALGTTTSAKNPGAQAFGQGTKSAFDRLAQYYISMADKMFPVIEIDGGRPVEVVVQNGFNLTVAPAP